MRRLPTSRPLAAAVLCAPLALCLALAAPRPAAAGPAPTQEPREPVPQHVAAAPIRGRVVDPAGAPLANARVWQSGFEELRDGAWQLVHFTGLPRPAFTDADGRFELPAREGLRYDLDVDLLGRAPAFVLGLEPGAAPRIVLQRGATVRGRVVQLAPDGPRPVPHARVGIERPNERGLWFQSERLTGAEGQFVFDAFLAPDDVDAGWELVFDGARYPLDATPGEAIEDLLVEVRITRGGR